MSAVPHGMPPVNRVLLLLIPVAIGLGYFLAAQLAMSRPKRMVAVSLVAVIAALLLIRGIEGVPGLEPVNTRTIGGCC